MIPQTALALVGFLLFVAPGFLYLLLVERHRPGVDESTFREISRVALASTVFSGLSIVLLEILRAFVPSWFPDPRAISTNAGGYLGENFNLVVVAVVAEVGLACLLAWLAYLLTRGDGHSSRHSLMWTVLHRSTDKSAIPIALIRLDDDTVYLGEVAAIEWGVSADEREIALGPPMTVVRPTHDGLAEQQHVPPPWSRVILPTRRITEMWVAFREASADSAEGPALDEQRTP